MVQTYDSFINNSRLTEFHPRSVAHGSGADSMPETQQPILEVLYNGECPFCRSYVAYCRLKEFFPDVILTDARTVPDRVAEYRGKGIEINEGMIVAYHGAIYHGDAAMTVLTQISRPNALLQ